MFEKLNEATAKPVVWSAYTTDVLWTTQHIAQQMLAYHLNPDVNAASRSFDFIDESVAWLISSFDLGPSSKTIDFGCGPGLYTQRLKAAGIGTVVGLDFSQNSLTYAAEQANLSCLAIEYHLGDYLQYQDSRKFDLITLVMCDLCALSPSQRSVLLAKFKSLLAPDGVIALDVYTAKRFTQQTECLNLEQNAMNGFWSANNYWCIQSSFKYDTDLVTLDKYVIIEKETKWVVYNWLQHFTFEMLNEELEQHGLQIQACYSDLCGTSLVKRGGVEGDGIEGDEMAVIIRHK